MSLGLVRGRAPPRERSKLLPIAGAVALISAVHFFLIEPLGLLRLQSGGFTALPAEEKVFVDFGNQVALIGYDAGRLAASPGEELRVTLYWQAERPLDINYQVFLHLLGPDQRLVAQSDKLNPGDYPTKRWPTDQYVRDEHRLRLPSGLPAGRYHLSAGLWVANDGWRLPLLDPHGEQVADNFVFPEPVMVGPER